MTKNNASSCPPGYPVKTYHTTFFSFINKQISLLYRNGQQGTAQNYRRARNSFFLFCQSRDIEFSSLTDEFISGYERWLKTREVTRNTISFYMRILRAVYNKAVETYSIPQCYPFKHVYTGIEHTRKRAVTKETILKLKKLDLSASFQLSYARDLFFFSFYTRGMAFVDMAYLRKRDITGDNIRYTRRKTGQSIHIFLEPCMKEIIDTYSEQTEGSEYVFPIIFSEKPSEAYKQYRNTLSNYNKKLRRLSGLLSLNSPLSSYVARHTWATIARNMEIPLTVISESMGHTSEQTTRIYLASLEQDVIDNANKKILNSLL